jgi:hypothetical protein
MHNWKMSEVSETENWSGISFINYYKIGFNKFLTLVLGWKIFKFDLVTLPPKNKTTEMNRQRH